MHRHRWARLLRAISEMIPGISGTTLGPLVSGLSLVARASGIYRTTLVAGLYLRSTLVAGTTLVAIAGTSLLATVALTATVALRSLLMLLRASITGTSTMVVFSLQGARPEGQQQGHYQAYLFHPLCH